MNARAAIFHQNSIATAMTAFATTTPEPRRESLPLVNWLLSPPEQQQQQHQQHHQQHVVFLGDSSPQMVALTQSNNNNNNNNDNNNNNSNNNMTTTAHPQFEVYFGDHTMVPTNTTTVQKRYRDDDSWSTVAMTPTVVSPHGSNHKRSRSNNYQPPRQVPPSVISTMGSLVGGSMQQTNLSVQLRRQLSGSRLDQYIGNHDRMDEDTTAATASSLRPRSMSF